MNCEMTYKHVPAIRQLLLQLQEWNAKIRLIETGKPALWQNITDSLIDQVIYEIKITKIQIEIKL